jgi:hypothetical protein
VAGNIFDYSAPVTIQVHSSDFFGRLSLLQLAAQKFS